LRGSVLFSVDTPFVSWLADRVEEVPLTHIIDSKGSQTQLSRTPHSGVIGPPGTTSVSKLSSRQLVGAQASEHQILMSGRRAPEA
jgi:hypothetical protein